MLIPRPKQPQSIGPYMQCGASHREAVTPTACPESTGLSPDNEQSAWVAANIGECGSGSHQYSSVRFHPVPVREGRVEVEWLWCDNRTGGTDLAELPAVRNRQHPGTRDPAWRCRAWHVGTHRL